MSTHHDELIGIDATGDGGHHVVLSGVIPLERKELHVREPKAEKLVPDPLRHL